MNEKGVNNLTADRRMKEKYNWRQAKLFGKTASKSKIIDL